MITLYRGLDEWLARWSGAGAAEIVELFGTDTLPTAWGPRAPAGVVLADIRRLNPAHVVCLRHD